MSYDEVSDFKNLLRCGLKSCNGGRWKPSIQRFELTILMRTSRNRQKLINHKYKPRKTTNFYLMERGKRRHIKAHKVDDRQVYKTFCKYELKPNIESRIIQNNAASQIGKGTDYAVKCFRRGLTKASRKYGNDFYVITVDYHDYFNTIPHDNILKTIRFNDHWSNILLKDYIEIFEGDSGIGIGGEPSQDISIVYPSKVDRMLQCEPCVIDSSRYMDDIYAITHTKEEARMVLDKIRKVSNSLGLIINEKHTKIHWMKKDYVVWLKKKTHITETGKIYMEITRKNVKAELKNIDRQKKLIDSGLMPRETADISIVCWCSYACNYNSYNQLWRVVSHYSETFGVPWEIAKILLRKKRKGYGFIIQDFIYNRMFST